MRDNRFLTQADKVCELFCNFFDNKGFSCHSYQDNNLGYGAMARKDDKFVPIFQLCIWQHPKSYTINVEDRNGNTVLMGELAAMYSLDIQSNMTDEEVFDTFKTMLNDIYIEFGNYNKKNRLDFEFNNMEIEKREYPITIKENENYDIEI